jgi:hypothetical protein
MTKTALLLLGGCLARINNELDAPGITTQDQLKNVLYNKVLKTNRYQRYAFDWEQLEPWQFEDDTPCLRTEGQGWTKENGLCWKIMRKNRKGVKQTKALHKKRCMKFHGRLLAPEDTAGNDHIFTYLKNKGFNETKDSEFFLGINDGLTEGEYKFDNSPLEVAYTNFDSAAEANTETVNEVVYQFPQTTWNRRATSDVAHAICVRFPGVNAMTRAERNPINKVNAFLNEGHIEKMEKYLDAIIEEDTVCEEEWTEVNGRCWNLRNVAKSKKAAKAWCVGKASKLLEINSADDQQNLITFLNDNNFGTKDKHTIWIPVNDGKSEGNFKIDNTCKLKGRANVDSCTDAPYTNFSTESDNVNDSTKNSAYYSHATQLWHHATKDDKARFICAKGKYQIPEV